MFFVFDVDFHKVKEKTKKLERESMEDLPFYGDESASDDFGNHDKNIDRDLSQLKVSYTPLHLEKMWFVSKCPEDDDEMLTLCKYKAHAEFQKRNFADALNFYEKCRALLPSNANLLMKEILEGQVRCLIELKRFEEAECIVKLLFNQKGNPQDSSLWFLLSNVYEKMEKLEDAVDCLQECLVLHPDYATYWFRLAVCFGKLATKESYERHLVYNFNMESINSSQSNKDSTSEKQPFAATKYFEDIFVSQIKQGKAKLTTLEGHKNETGESNIGVGSSNSSGDGDENKVDCNGIGTDSKDKNTTMDGSVQKGCCSLLNGLMLSKNDEVHRILSCSCCQTTPLIRQFEHIFVDTDHAFARLNMTNKEQQRSSELDSNKELPSGNCFISNYCTDECTSSQDELHFIIWRSLMRCLQCCATVKSWILLRKTVQYSKGFAKDGAKATSLLIESHALDLLHSKSNLQRLSEILDHADN